MKQIIFLLFPGLEILDFAGPLQTFVEARNHGCGLVVKQCSWESEIRASQDIHISRIRHFSKIKPEQIDIIFIPGLESRKYTEEELEKVPDQVFDWLKSAYQCGVQLCSICTGSFVLAHTGLLNGRKCTTHWSRTHDLQRMYPECQVKRDCLFIYDKGIYTSAGATSGIDLSLAIVEENWGPQITAKIARELVVYVRRDSTHQQTSIYLDYRDHLNPGIHNIQDWLLSNPGKKYTIESLADLFGLSQRNLTRLFKKSTGITINQYSTLVTLEHAKNLMKNPENTIDSTAIKCGFHDAKQLRRLWKKHFGTTPSHYRSAF